MSDAQQRELIADFVQTLTREQRLLWLTVKKAVGDAAFAEAKRDLEMREQARRFVSGG